ncbi:MAG: hypothetical protein HY271_10300 [Deltaproteobacteria bacterium]|nr:hypothetical protein [Deltaproteobacteria bacterium]
MLSNQARAVKEIVRRIRESGQVRPVVELRALDSALDLSSRATCSAHAIVPIVASDDHTTW